MTKIKEINQEILLLFQQYGIRSLTMDDIAHKLGCSKKTLYVFYQNRDDLVNKVISQDMEIHEKEIHAVVNKKHNPIDEIFLLNKLALKKIKTVHPTTQYELRKYYPSAWKTFDEKHKKLVYEVTLSNLNNGIKNNLYRKEINPEIMARIFAEKIDLVFNGIIFNSEDISFGDVFIEFMTHYVYGIVNENGKIYFLQTLNKSD